MHHRRLLSAVSILGLATSTALAALQIVPGGTWTASNGDHLNAHGAGVIRVNSTFYLIGEDKSQGSSFLAVNCYSSVDLVQWKYEGALLSRTGTSGDLGPNRIVERPKVIYNDQTRKYVMWMHVDSSNYGDAKVGVATSDTVCGRKYEYKGSFRPLGMESRDMGLFKDDDGKAYLLTEDRKNGLRINPLSPDYLSISGSTSTHLFPTAIESPALLKLSSSGTGRYYIFGSHLTGWDPNDNVYATATSLSGPWSDWQIFADKGSNTYASQTTFVLDYGGGNVMYMGDRWKSKNLQTSSYIWLPLEISGTKVTMNNRGSWVPNAGTGGGTWAASPAETSYEGEAQGKYAGGAKEVSCSKCSGGKAAGYIGGTGGTNGSVTISGIQSNGGEGAVTTLQIRYVNGDTGPRYAAVSVNGGSPQKVAFEGTAGEVGVSSVVVRGLRQGSGNTIVVSGWEGGGWGPDVDRVVVPVQ